MAKTSEEILQELFGEETISIDSLVSKLTTLSTVQQQEIRNIISRSVKPLPNIVKDQYTVLKDRMVDIVIDENKGTVSIINKRNVLLLEIIKLILDKTNELDTNKLDKTTHNAFVQKMYDELAKKLDEITFNEKHQLLEQKVDENNNNLEQEIANLKSEDSILNELITALDNTKFDKAGGTITGDVVVEDTLQTDRLRVMTDAYSENLLVGDTFRAGEEKELLITKTKATYGASELGTKADLALKLDTTTHQAFKAEMDAEHNSMRAEHNALASNLQAQINTIKEVLQSDDLNLDTFQEIVNVLKGAGADINAIFTQLGLKANTNYVDEQNLLDRAYTDAEVNKAVSNFNTAMAGHKLEVQDQVDEYTRNVEAYVDKSVGDIPAVLDYLIEVSA